MLSTLLSACGGSGDDNPGPSTPIFADPASVVSVTESEWRFDGVSALSSATARFGPGDATAFLTETMREGNCRMLESVAAFCPACDGVCVGGACQPWPTRRSAGSITVDGLTAALTLSFRAGGYYLPDQSAVPAELFAAGDEITAVATGSEVAAFAVHGHGVAGIAPELDGDCTGELHLEGGRDAVITWPDSGSNARVHLWMPSANDGHGLPPLAVIECEGRDTGTLRIPAAQADLFPAPDVDDTCQAVLCAGTDCPPASLARYADSSADDVVLRVQSELLFHVHRTVR